MYYVDLYKEAHQTLAKRDFLLFGPFRSNLSHWMDAACWSLEEAVAISLGKDPSDLSLEVISRKCPDEIERGNLARGIQEKAALSPLVQLFLNRCNLLQRAAIAGELAYQKDDGKYWLKPTDFLRWFDAKSETCAVWGLVPHAVRGMQKHLNIQTDCSKDGASPDAEVQCRAFLIGEMEKYPGRLPKTKNEYEGECKDKFGVGTHAYWRAWASAKDNTNYSGVSRGRRKQFKTKK